MDASKTSISAGLALAKILWEDQAVSGRVTRIFPVAIDSAELPFIVFRTVGLEQEAVKSGAGADTAQVEVMCCAEGYEEAVELAEAVRGSLDGVSYSDEEIRMRGCRLSDHDEFWEGDAYVERLVFDIRI